MDFSRVLVPIFLLSFVVTLSAFAGCSSDSGPAATPSPTATVPATTATPVPAPLTTPPTTVPTLEPTHPLPPERQVNLLLTKDRPTSEIHLLYQGGPGDMFVDRILMRVYDAVGTYHEYYMSNGGKPKAGDEIIAPGTRGGDRCEVFVISAGTRYKVMDQPVYGGMYY